MGIADLYYIIARLIRRHTPKRLIDFFLDHSFIIKPGAGTANPEELLNSYLAAIEGLPSQLNGRSVLELGFGGNIAIGLLYHLHGASEIYLVDPYAKDRTKKSAEFLKGIIARYPEHDFKAQIKDNSIWLSPDTYKVYFKGLKEIELKDNTIDFISCASVLEHVDNVKEALAECYKKLKPGGYLIAFIDLGDHFHKYPFNMLKYTQRAWNSYLNPPSNLNRWRTLDYEKVFAEVGFSLVKKEVNKDYQKFSKIQQDLDVEFKKYPVDELAVLSVLYICQKP